jgi:hypothetical protein
VPDPNLLTSLIRPITEFVVPVSYAFWHSVLAANHYSGDR